MANLDGWDIAVLCVAGYVALITLVRLMQQHREQVMARLRADFEARRAARSNDEKTDKATATGKSPARTAA